MEEKKLKNEERRLSYEELQERCGEMFQRLQIMRNEMVKMDATNTIQRLNFLFKVIENVDMFDPKFIEYCVNEIQNTLMIPEEREEEKDNG